MRKEWKRQARTRMKRSYWLLVVLCLLMAITKIDYSSTLKPIATDTSEGVEEDINSKVMTALIEGRAEDGHKIAQRFIERQKKETSKIGIIAVGHSRGVFSDLVNSVSSGNTMNMIYQALDSITGSKSESIIFFIILSLLFSIFMKIFVINVFAVTVKRVVMELRQYDKVPMNRFLFLVRIKRMVKVAWTMFLTTLFSILWGFTIIGGMIKAFSYMMVPYILAENPDISGKEAITLSRKMMKGHKWQAFVLNLSFIGWDLLEGLTWGLSGILYSNPYKEMTNAEYYNYIRACAKENQIPGSDLLNDTYLYEKADKETLKGVYSDIQDRLKAAEAPVEKHTGFRGILENVFGLTIFYDADEAKYQEKKSAQNRLANYKEIMNQNMYPFRLNRLAKTTETVKMAPVQYDRHYSIFSIILIFFSMSFVGWCWEVSLHLISDGVFVNRGVYHGPWLPIYGFGAVLMLIFLNKFRTNPMLEFVLGVILCGVVEYTSAWYLETTHGGTKWWDYTGYFLNIHGRVCAEGLLVFGLGGLAITYLLAPQLDNRIRKIPNKIVIPIALSLLAIFIGDAVYSSKHPNAGKGITDYSGCVEQVVDTEDSLRV